MRIEHPAVYFADLEGAKTFFEKYFGAAAGDLYRNERTGFSSYFLTFEGGERLEIMNRPETSADSCFRKNGYDHIAFAAGSREKVDELTERLKNDGYKVATEPRVTGDGYYESCIIDFEGNKIEITV